MSNLILPQNVRTVLQLLADNRVLGKTKPNRMSYEKLGTLYNIQYMTPKYRFLFFQMSPSRQLHDGSYGNNVYNVIFPPYSRMYTPFLYPILNPNKDENLYELDLTAPLSYGQEILALEEIITKAKYILDKAGLSEKLLPQFLALSSSSIYEKKVFDEEGENYFGETRLSIEGQVKFTTVQIVKYLQETNDVEDIVDMWLLGVLPEQYKSFKEDYADVPMEWIKAVFEGGIKEHWVREKPTP